LTKINPAYLCVSS